MGLGNTAKKLQSLAEVAEKLVEQFTALRERVIKLESTADETHERVTELESEVKYQQALLEAIAAEHDIDLSEVSREEQPATGEETTNE